MTLGVDIAHALMPRRARIGDTTYLVPPPSVRVAFMVLLLATHDDEEERLSAIFNKWLPEDLYAAMWEMGPTQRGEKVRELLFRGTEEPERTDEETGERLTLEDIWFDYCETFNLDPAAAMDTTPFPLFLRAQGRIYQIRAQRMLRGIDVASAPHYSKEGFADLNKALRKAAGYAKAADQSEPTEEEIAKDREALRQYMQTR